MAKAGDTKLFRLNNLGGGINSQAEANALASFDYNGQGVQAEANDIENFYPSLRGGQSKTTGFSTFYNTGSANKITGLYRYKKSDGTSLFLYGQTTKVYKLVSGTATDIGATFASGAYLQFETALDKLIICDGASAPVTWDGTTTGSLTSGPAVLRGTLFYQNRLWGFGNTGNNGSYVYYSDAGTLDNMGSNFVTCDANDGQKIVAISKYFIPGLLAPIILVEKERSVGVITGDGSTADPYTFLKINQDAGGAGFRTAVQFGQDIAYLTPKGVTSYKTDNSIVNLSYLYISEKVRDKFIALNQANLSSSIGVYDWKNSRITWAVPETTNTTPNVLWHYDTRLGCWYKERWNIGQDCTAMIIDTDGKRYHGDSNGKIYVVDESGGFDGQAINAFYKTSFLDFGDPNLYKKISQARISFRTKGVYAVGIATRLNYGERQGRSSTLPVKGNNYKWGGGTWNNTGVYKWSGPKIQNAKYFPAGDFRNIEFTFSQSGLNQPVDLFEIEFMTQFTGLM